MVARTLFGGSGRQNQDISLDFCLLRWLRAPFLKAAVDKIQAFLTEQLRPPATARTNSAAASSAFYKKSDTPKWHVASNLMLIFKTVNRSRNQTATVNHVGRTCRVDAHDRRMTEEAAEFHGLADLLAGHRNAATEIKATARMP